MRILAIDQGTTGTKAFSLADDGTFSPIASFAHRQIYPGQDQVEHDPEELLAHVGAAVAAAGDADAIGIDNQGETVVAWDARSGRPIHNAIVWQDSRSKGLTERLKAEGAEVLTLERAGLPLDPYFSASKFRWLLDNVPEARQLRREGRLRLGTSDSFFLDRITGQFATDVTTASRTCLMSLATFRWDPELCGLFDVPMECLPEIRPTTGPFGEIGGTPVTASLVDQQAALFGHGCASQGEAKITFGTGAFALAVAGTSRIEGGRFGILPTVAWQIGHAAPMFALDGGVYNAASAVNWAKGLGLFSDFGEIEHFDAEPAISRRLAFVPALSGLACPHWDRRAAGLWIGMGLETSRADMMQSVLEGIALRTAEVVAAMAELVPLGGNISIDGGLSRNSYFVHFLADLLGRTITMPATAEVTALGTARMAFLGSGARQAPELAAPRKVITPRSFDIAEARSVFGEAVARAKAWRGGDG
jgi:glycerol kinase